MVLLRSHAKGLRFFYGFSESKKAVWISAPFVSSAQLGELGRRFEPIGKSQLPYVFIPLRVRRYDLTRKIYFEI